MASETTTRSGGMGAMGLLGVVFVTLKLIGITAVATWSWWWVTAPFWGGLAIALSIFLIAALCVGVAAVFSK